MLKRRGNVIMKMHKKEERKKEERRKKERKKEGELFQSFVADLRIRLANTH